VAGHSVPSRFGRIVDVIIIVGVARIVRLLHHQQIGEIVAEVRLGVDPVSRPVIEIIDEEETTLGIGVDRLDVVTQIDGIGSGLVVVSVVHISCPP